MKDLDQNGCILAFRNDRLGARLNVILTAMRLAKAYEMRLRVFWSVTENSSPELHNPADLFAQDFIDRYFTSREEGNQVLQIAHDLTSLSPGLTQKKFIAEIQTGQAYLANSATTQVLMPWENSTDLAVLPELLEGIAFNPTVQRVIARIDARLSGLSFKSYHLRRGDITDDASAASHNLWPDKYIPRVIYERHMQRELAHGDGMLIVFSDAKAESAAFAALSPRIRSFDDLVGNEVLKPLQRDFLELYTMSRSTAIFAPPNSAFSGTAALLGNKQVIDITADLSATDYDAAMEELVDRLERRPELFFSQSDVGQNLPYIARHLDKAGNKARASDIGKALVHGGMDRAYGYSFLSERLLAQGDYAGCDAVVQLLGQRICYREEHFSTVFLHGAMADLLRGRHDRAIGRFHSGSWYYPVNRLASETFFYLAASGLLSSRNSYPFDPNLMRKAGRIYDESASPAHQLLMQKLRDEGRSPLHYPAHMEVRDWRRLQGKKLNFRFSNKGKLVQQAEMVARGISKAKDPRHAAQSSAAGALWAEAGRFSQAEPMLKAALDTTPHQPLYHKRLADFYLATGNPTQAIASLNEACTLSGNSPFYQAELALALFSQRKTARYIALMTSIDLSAIPIPELHFLQIDAARRNPDLLPGLPARLVEMESMAPQSHRLIGAKAIVFEQLKKWDEALACLSDLRLMGRAETVIVPRISRLFAGYRKEYGEQAALSWLSAHGVSQPGI